MVCGRAMNKGMPMLRQAAKTIARHVPAIDRLIKQRDDLLIEVERLKHQLAKEDVIVRWAKGIKFERDFWANWLQTKGAQWPADYQSKLDPECPLDGAL